MLQNPGHIVVAKNIIKQVEQGKIPSMEQAAVDADYAVGSTNRISKANTFQRALWDASSYSLIAATQRKQLKASYIKRISWGKDAPIPKVAKFCMEHELWRLLRIWKEDKEVYTLLEIPNHEQIDKALDKFYKIGGFYAAEKVEHQVTRPLEEMNEQEIDKIIAQHSQQQDVKRDTTTPNVITGLAQADIIEGEPLN